MGGGCEMERRTWSGLGFRMGLIKDGGREGKGRRRGWSRSLELREVQGCSKLMRALIRGEVEGMRLKEGLVGDATDRSRRWSGDRHGDLGLESWGCSRSCSKEREGMVRIGCSGD